jgi:hypothetical protein
MEPEVSLPGTQEPFTGPYPETNECSLRSILILSYHLRLYLPSGQFSSGFPTSSLYAFISPWVRRTLLISSSMTWSL